MPEVTARGIRFHVQRLGCGPRTVVFLHGLVMDNLSSWFFTVAGPVAQVAQAVLFDLRGHGLSERPASAYGLDEMTADLGGVLDALGLARPVILAGNSFGALLALTFASEHRERVEGLVLVDGQTGTPGWGERMAGTLALEGVERDRRIAESFKSWLGRHSERKRNRLAKNAEALVRGTTLVADMRASRPVSDEALRAIRCPTLGLYGAASDVRADAERLERLVPACELRWFAGCTHSVLWEATARVRDAVVDWVRGLPAAKEG